MAARKAKPKAKPGRKSGARRPAPKTAAKKKAAPKKAPNVPARRPAPGWGAAQKSEFETIRARAKSLGASLRKADFDNDGNPVPGSPWATMLAELDAWARKYNVTFARRDHDHAPGAGRGGAAAGDAAATPLAFGGGCPGSFSETSKREFVGMTQVRTTSCTLRRQTWLGRCVYDCVETIDWV